MRARASSERSLSLPWRVFLGGVVVLAVALALVFVVLSRWAQRSGESIVRRELEQSADLADQFLAGRLRSLVGGARVFVQGPYFRAIVAENRRDDIIDQTFEAAAQLDADWVFIVDERGILLAKSDEPSASGADLGGVPLVAGALQGRVTSGFGVSRDSLLFQAVAVPIVVPGAAPLGALVATKIVDSALARDVKTATSADIVFYVRDGGTPRIAATSFDRAQRAPLDADAVSQTRAYASVNGVRYATQRSAATTAGGEIVGGYVVMSARDAASAEIAEVRRALLLAAAIGVLLLAGGALVLDRRVSRPLRELTAYVRRSGHGPGDTAHAFGTEHWAAREELSPLVDAVHALVDDVHDRETLAAVLSGALPAAVRLHAAASSAIAATPVRSLLRIQGAAGRPGTASRIPATPAPDAPAGDAPGGDVIAGRYRVEAVLGESASGVTYRVRDRVTSSTLALKRFAPSRLDDGIVTALDGLKEELKAPSRFVHRNVVRVRDVGDDAGVPFVTMDYVEGMSLAALLAAAGPLEDDAVLAIAKQLCRALAAGERHGVVHGRLTPRRILIGYDGVLRVSDFTLAGLERGASAHSLDANDVSGRASEIPRLAGATVGAPEYMSPEQLIGEAPSAQSDLYAAGVVLYECVTGATPFRTDSPLAFLAQKLGDAESAAAASQLRSRRPHRDPAAHVLHDVIARMIAPEASKRARSAGELLDRLEHAG